MALYRNNGKGGIDVSNPKVITSFLNSGINWYFNWGQYYNSLEEFYNHSIYILTGTVNNYGYGHYAYNFLNMDNGAGHDVSVLHPHFSGTLIQYWSYSGGSLSVDINKIYLF